MAFGDLWNRTLVYFGIAEEYDEAWDEYASEEELEQSYAERQSANVRRLTPRRRRDYDYDDWTVTDSDVRAESASRAPTVAQTPSRSSSASARKPRPMQAVPSMPPVQVHLVLPRSFNDAQQIADKFKHQIPVIVNLQSADQDLSKRLIDFSSGLTYALNGNMQRVADRVFLLTPHNVEVSAEERARVLERGGFFNQA
jgi:cell division inhibitor SepF